MRSIPHSLSRSSSEHTGGTSAKKVGYWQLIIAVTTGLAASCLPSSPSTTQELALLGGQVTVRDATRNAFSHSAPGLTRDQELQFAVGDSLFTKSWVQAPSSTTARDGLGPLFNALSCSSCHFKDGRGRPPEAGEVGTGVVVRLSIPGVQSTGGPLPEPTYGGHLQDQAIDAVAPEGQFTLSYSFSEGSFSDGTTYELRWPEIGFPTLHYGAMHADTEVSIRVANPVIGIGLLEAVPEQTILEWSDPEDRDQDGVSGRPNWVWSEQHQATVIGRFGWKANQPSTRQQVASAFLADMGITNDLFPRHDCPRSARCADLQSGVIPDIFFYDIDKVTFYTNTLAVPAQRSVGDVRIERGRKIFKEAGCETCHRPSMTTGEHPTIPALSNQTIRPYTDLLLHDMGPGLADNRADFEASGSEWRTPPLWGIGLVETVNGHTTFLHDGRARNLMEAVLWHDGEAAASRLYVVDLSASDRQALVQFLNSL